ncbi:helix-turn-helix domain-containing protein [Symbioplanes lichenis]|uniref:helix-turn-helix domain-containing protein n=1 Tax=Symbioplanes lichenis TaxID=1629072 RepID=UPI00273842D1|nr:helix-turn-helix transcriptional regulator [Actinoplanes lichenis]
MRGDLADFLRARRALVGPAAVGLVPGGRRHVRGLRREELALVAGISVDYYVRLEQGRDRHPSPAVVGALARALRLDADATAHLHRIAAGPVEPAGGASVRPSVARLVDTSPWPAVLLDGTLTVLRANAAARELNPRHEPGRSLVRDAFLDPATAALHVDVAAVRAECAAALRSAGGAEELVTELLAASAAFRELWSRADVSYCRTGTKLFDHPVAGRLCLDYETLDVGESGGQRLLVYSRAGADDLMAG